MLGSVIKDLMRPCGQPNTDCRLCRLCFCGALRGDYQTPAFRLYPLTSLATERYTTALQNLNGLDAMAAKMKEQFGRLQGWSALHDSVELCVKKMIASELISRVKVHSDYKLDIQFNISYQQFFGSTNETYTNLALQHVTGDALA